MDYLRDILLLLTMILFSACGGGGGSTTDSPNTPSVPSDTPPTVNAGADKTYEVGATVTLSGSGSDANGTVTFLWEQNSGDLVTLSNSSIANPTFVAPMVTTPMQLTFTLTVTDDTSNSTSDTVVVTISVVNSTPVADAGADQTVNEGVMVNLVGSGNDAEGPVTFQWSQVSGTAVVLSDDSIGNPSFNAPSVTSSETLIFRLTVSDDAGASMFDDVSIEILNKTTPPSAASGYLFYSNSLNAVDPANAAAPILLEPNSNLVIPAIGITATAQIMRFGDYNGADQSLNNERNYAVIYPKADGTISKIAAQLAGTPTPVQISNETEADHVCTSVIGGRAVHVDLENVNNSVYVYVLPGIDTGCDTDDDIWKIVRIGMSATESPILAKRIVANLYDFSNGSISGWLVHESQALQRCDANFENCISVVSKINSVDWRLSASTESLLLEIDNRLHIYSITAQTLSPARFSIPAGTYVTVPESDGTTVYFANGNVLYQMKADGSEDATEIITETKDIQRVVIGQDRLVYQLGIGGSGDEIKSVPMTGGKSLSLALGGADEDLLLLYLQGRKVYFNKRNTIVSPIFSMVPILAGVINEDGSDLVEVDSAVWFGAIFKTSYPFSSSGRLSEILKSTFLLEGYNIANTSGGFAGATVKVVDAATATVGKTLGTLPETDKIIDFQCYGFLDISLCSALIEKAVLSPIVVPVQNDVFFVNTASENSLLRVTNTPDDSEVVLF